MLLPICVVSFSTMSDYDPQEAGIGFLTADKLARAAGLTSSSPERLRSVIRFGVWPRLVSSKT